MKGQPSQTELASTKGGIVRSESNGILDLLEGAEKRKHGSELIARQTELENMKAR